MRQEKKGKRRIRILYRHPPVFESTNDELTRLSSASLLIEAAMSTCSPFPDNAPVFTKDKIRVKKSVIERRLKRVATERRIEEELSRSSGRRRPAKDKEEESGRTTREREKERARKARRKSRTRRNSETRSEGEEAERRKKSYGAVVETKVEVVIAMVGYLVP